LNEINNLPSQDDMASNSFRPCEHSKHLDLAMLRAWYGHFGIGNWLSLIETSL